MNGADIVESTTDAAFAVDARGRIAAWNRAAEGLFGYSTAQVLDHRCWEVLRGRDIFGNDYCNEHCQLRQMARRQQPVHPCHLVFNDATGSQVRARLSLIRASIEGRPGWSLVHLVSSATPRTASLEASTNSSNNVASRLTVREAEVLKLLGEGYSTRRVAESLGLSVATVRNHVQHILGKLRVHSRLEAVAMARRLGMAD